MSTDRRIAALGPLALLLLLLLALVASACLTQRDLDKPVPGWREPEPPHLAVRRTKGEKGTLLHEWTVLAQAGHDDVLHGKDSTWHTNGAKEWEREFARGKPKGTWRRWHPNGQQESETTFAGPDVEKPMRFWHDNGQLAAEGLAKDGARCGTWKFWRADGTLREEGTYVGSQREGTWTVWGEPGSPPHTVEYVKGTITTER